MAIFSRQAKNKHPVIKTFCGNFINLKMYKTTKWWFLNRNEYNSLDLNIPFCFVNTFAYLFVFRFMYRLIFIRAKYDIVIQAILGHEIVLKIKLTNFRFTNSNQQSHFIFWLTYWNHSFLSSNCNLYLLKDLNITKIRR